MTLMDLSKKPQWMWTSWAIITYKYSKHRHWYIHAVPGGYESPMEPKNPAPLCALIWQWFVRREIWQIWGDNLTTSLPRIVDASSGFGHNWWHTNLVSYFGSWWWRYSVNRAIRGIPQGFSRDVGKSGKRQSWKKSLCTCIVLMLLKLVNEFYLFDMTAFHWVRHL
jgi:hypothetical protein